MSETVRTWWREGRPLLSRWTHTKDGGQLTWIGRACNVYHSWTRWVRPTWWLYVFAPYDTYWRWPWGKHQHARRRSCLPTWNPFDRLHIWWPKVIWCRLRGHPAGIVYFNAGGLEPDTSCRNCGEEIG